MLRVLSVEDNEEDAILIFRQFEKAGYSLVSKRVDAEQSLIDSLKFNSWDVVLSDYVLPELDGLRALKVFSETKFDIPFILVSGEIGENIAAVAIKTGASDFVKKSNLKDLVKTVERYLPEPHKDPEEENG